MPMQVLQPMMFSCFFLGYENDEKFSTITEYLYKYIKQECMMKKNAATHMHGQVVKYSKLGCKEEKER